MKKLLFVLALGVFAACNSGETKTPPVDSSAVKVDTSVAAPVDTAAKAAVDTTKK